MNNFFNQDMRKELLRTDIIPRKLNDISQKYKDLLLKDIQEAVIKTENIYNCECGSTELEQLTKIDRFGLPFGSLICKDCGLILTSPRIKQESLSYYYDKFYHPLNYGKETMEDQAVLYAEGQGKKIFNLLKDSLPNKQKISVLEIGAGTGSVLKEFKAEASLDDYEVDELGTEYSNECINACKKNGVNVIHGDIETISKEKKIFDLIILSHVFEHFIDLKLEISRIKSLLSENGLVYLEVPGILSIHKRAYYDFSYLGYHIHAHMYNFTANTLKSLLAKEGLISILSNEEVELVLKRGTEKFVNSDYQKIINYLDFLNENNEYFLSENIIVEEDKKLLRTKTIQIENRNSEIEKLSKQVETRDNKLDNLSGMIENRDSEIKKLSTQLENRDSEIKKLSTQLQNRSSDLQKLSKQIEVKDKEIKTLAEQIQLILNLLNDFKRENIIFSPKKKKKAYENLIKITTEIKELK